MGTKLSKESSKSTKQDGKTTKEVTSQVIDAKDSSNSTKSQVNTSGSPGITTKKLTPGSDYAHFNSKLSIDDFDLLKVLGKGSFGKVMLVQKKGDKSGTLYAMKTLRKAALVKRNQLVHTSTERNILQNMKCPFLVHLNFAFQTSDKLYMVLDYLSGGELFFWLKKTKKFSENRAKLYAAEIAMGLNALHSADIIYRDLKPENILLDTEGHIRLTDFGLAKGGITGYGLEGGTKTFCGTPEYLAPEILENKGHGKAVDWWALGTLLYEMLTGLPPFYDTNVQRMYHKILHEPLRFPKGEGRQISEVARDFLKGLLERRIAMRTCSGEKGILEFMDTPFMSCFTMEKLMTKSYKAEFIPPAATSQTDVSNFDRVFTEQNAADSMVVQHMTDSMQEKSKFDGFTYQNDPKMSA